MSGDMSVAAIRERWSRATPGPFKLSKSQSPTIWHEAIRPHDGFPFDTPICTFHNRTRGSGNGDPQMLADAEFHASAWDDIAALLALVSGEDKP